MSDINDAIGENFTGGKESESSVQERLKEMQEKAKQNAGVKQHMKKQEGKARQTEDAIVQFLIRFVHSGASDHVLLSALNNALAHNHSPYVLMSGLELLYNIQNIEESNDQQIVVHTHQEALQLATWLKHLEEAAYENPERTVGSIILHPSSITKFIEAVLQTYKHLYPSAPVPMDLVEVSQNIVMTLQKLLERYISQHSLK